MDLNKKKYGSMTIYLTLNCNLKCKYCFCGKKYKNEMTHDIIEKILKFYDKISVENANITFFGGEPLLKLDLIRYVIFLNDKYYNSKFRFSITTNGTLLTKEVYNYLRENNVDILLSLDGNKESHDENRKFYTGEGSWATIRYNISEFYRELPIRMTFSKETVRYLYKNISSLYEEGFNNIAFYPASGEDWKESDIDIFNTQVKLLIDYFYHNYCQGKIINSNWIDKSIWRHICDFKDSCSPGINQLSVTPEGNFYPCNHTNFENSTLKIGNIYEGLNIDKIQWIQEQINILNVECNECALKKRCNYCYINMYEETGHLWEIPDWFCNMNQIIILNSDLLATKLYNDKNKYFLKKFYNK